MRARIVYTVDVSEIPSEVERLKKKAEKLLSSSLSAVTDANIDQSIEKTLVTLEEASQSLVTIDLLLKDSCAILEGYLMSKLDPENLSSVATDETEQPGEEG